MTAGSCAAMLGRPGNISLPVAATNGKAESSKSMVIKVEKEQGAPKHEVALIHFGLSSDAHVALLQAEFQGVTNARVTTVTAKQAQAAPMHQLARVHLRRAPMG